MLTVENLKKSFSGPAGEVRAVDGVTLSVAPGEFVAVRGPSGCGKTTLLLAAGGLLEPESGRVEVAGEDVYRLPRDRRAGFRARTIGFVFQQFHLIPYLTVRENVLVAALGTGARDGEGRADKLLERFGLAHRRDHVPAALSTGERQRAALARALFNEPRLVLGDEPTGNLDRENARTVLEHLREFAASGGAVLLVTHDALAGEYAGRTLEMESGSLRAGSAAPREPGDTPSGGAPSGRSE